MILKSDRGKNEKENCRDCFLFIFLLAMAFYMDSSEGSLDGNNIRRNKVGEGSQQVDLILNAKGLKKDYKYSIDVKEELPTKGAG